MKKRPTFSLKDHLFNEKSVSYLSGLVAKAYPQFEAKNFVEAVLAPFPNLSLKERIVHMAESMKLFLPKDYPKALSIILRGLPPKLDPSLTDDDFGSYIIAPFSQFVAIFGIAEEHLDISLEALREITMRFSAEHSIRTFINLYPDRTYRFLEECCKNNNYHVRRLVSEGSRPTLPWDSRLRVDHTWPLPLLDQLFDDPTRYVTRSVANHLNDIAKIDPDLVIDLLKKWRKTLRQQPAEMDFIEKHALRTLVKQGHKPALEILGFGEKPAIEIRGLQCSKPQVKLGEKLHFSFDLFAKKDQSLLIDYRIHFAQPNNRASFKVFKLTQLAITKGEEINLKKNHPMRVMTTRKLYAGEHRVEIQANGQIVGSFSFELLTD